MLNKPRVLFISEFSSLSTGYAVYCREVISRLFSTQKYDVRELAAYASEEKIKERDRLPWSVYPNMPNSNENANEYHQDPVNQFGKFRFLETCLHFRPTVVITVKDNWMDSWVDLSPARPYFNWAWMVTADGQPINDEWIDTWSRVDGLFTYNDWSKQLLEKQSNGALNIICSTSPAATHEFRPIDKQQIKTDLGLSNATIIGTVMRNQRRKLFPDLFLSFKQLLQDTQRTDILLYCHTSYPDLGWDMPRLLTEYGVASKVLFTYVCKTCKNFHPSFFSDAVKICPFCKQATASLSNVQKAVSNEQLNVIYNLFDVYVQYATNEGFGIPMIEAAACGVPIMAVDYSAPEDVVRKLQGIPLRVQTLYREPDTGRHFAAPDNNYFVEKLKWFCNLPGQMRHLMGHKTLQLYQQHYNWNKTTKIWEQYIDSVDHSYYEAKWNEPAHYQQLPTKVPECNNADFVTWLIKDVLGDSNRLGTFFASKILRQLNYGVSMGHPLLNDDNGMLGRPQIRDFHRQDAYNMICDMVNRRNQWEQLRCQNQ